MTRIVLSTLFSHWRRHPLQLATLLVGLAISTALWSGVQAINAEARASYARAAEALTGDLPVLISQSGEIAQSDYIALRRAGWMVTPVVEGWIPAREGRIRLVGIDPLTAPQNIAAADRMLDEEPLAFISGAGRIVVEPETARQFDADGLPEIIVSEGLAPGFAFTDIGTAQRLLALSGELTRIILLEEQPLDRPPLLEVVPSLSLTRPDGTAGLARLTDSFHLNLTAFGFLSFAVGLFIVHGAIGLAFEQRRPVLRTLRALGVPARELALVCALELILIATLAAFLGMVMGYAVAAVLLPDVAATLRGLYGAPVSGGLTLRPSWWAGGIAIALTGTAVAAAGSLWKTYRLPILAPARPRAWSMAWRTSHRRQALAGITLGATGLMAGTLGSGLVAGFATLAAMLLSGALLLPALLSAFLGFASRFARHPVARWFWADTRQQLPGLGLALMALLLALSANVGVGTMVSSFRLTFTGWLDQRLAAELYVSASTEEEAQRLQEWLAPRTDAVLPIWNVERTIAGYPAEIFGVADHATYRDHWPLITADPGAWDAVSSGRAALINEQLARRAGLEPGEQLALPGGGPPVVVGGIYSDYGNPKAQVLVGIDTLTTRFPEVERLRFGIRVNPEAANRLTEEIVGDFGLPSENVVDQASLKELSLRIFERTFTVTGALNALTLGVAGIAMLTSLLTLATIRLPQLAPVWAIGVPRWELSLLEVARAVALSSLVFLLSLPLGILLAWVLLAVINVEAFGWRLPMSLFPEDWLRLGLLALGAGLVASAWPALRLFRKPPADLLRIFANER